MKIQPTKIILVNSANCQYAEFDLSDSLHLVALNNRGKTSIINTLQFLYIDSYKELDMGYTLDETWRHYFPQLGSYVLFEVNTLTGNKIFGLSATGMGAQPEKFLLDGAYRTQDFIETRENGLIARTPNNLFPPLGARLVKRDFSAKYHRDLLRPSSAKKTAIGLGIIGDTNDYRLFKQLFKQLLKLKGITIKDLKKQIEQVNQRVMEKQQIINVQREFNEPYSEIEKRKSEVQRLQYNRSNIEELLALNEQQAGLRGRLCSYFLKADVLFVSEDEKLQEEKTTSADSKKRIEDDELPSNQAEKEANQDEINKLNQRFGVLEQSILGYEELEKQCREIVPKLEQSNHSNLRGEIETLQKQLYQVEDVDIGQLEKVLLSRQQQKKKYQSQLKCIEDTLFIHLKGLLNEQELGLLYQLTNGELWVLFADTDFELYDCEALQIFLRKQLQNHQGGQWKIPGLMLRTGNISIAGLQELGNPDLLGQKIDQLTVEINKLQQQLTTLQEQEQLRQALQELQKQIKACESRLEKYQQWQKGQKQYQLWLDERTTIEGQINQYLAKNKELDARGQKLVLQVQQYEQTITRIEEEQQTLRQSKAWIERHPPGQDWKKIEVNYETVTFAELFELYAKHYKNLQQTDDNIHRKLSQLRDNFRQMAGMNDTQSLTFLREQLDAIPEKEKSIQDQWKGIFSSFAGHCRGMIDSVNAIDSYLADLNRLLGKQPISNLKSVKINLETNRWYRYIYNIMEWREDDLPLFSGINEAQGDKLQQAIKPLLEKVNISIADLYDLKLRVVDQYDQEKQYDSLQLESNGTSITVKTLIFISMINKAMEGKQRLGESIRIPFYVDEIDSLDDANAQNIHDTAQKLGLIPVFASPKGSGICKRLYQLENNQYGKVSVRKKSKDKLVLLKPTFERIG